MNKTALQRLQDSLLVVVSAAGLTACADRTPVGPDRESALETRLASTPSGSPRDARGPDLGSCGDLQVEAGNRLAYHVYAEGVQIYHWNGATWVFDGPLAELSADLDGRSVVGIHYSGPTWESLSGSKVVGAVLKRCTPDPAAIPWLLLSATSTDGPGIFYRVTYIQRLNTVGGVAPSDPGSLTGEEARVPYTAEYFFYRAQ